MRDLRSTPGGLSSREAARRLLQHGPNELRRRVGPGWPRALVRQLTHPLALLLWLAAGLGAVGGLWVTTAAVVVVILVNAALAMWQEHQAERAVEALQRYLPQLATVLRDGVPVRIDARTLVPGDVLLIAEGDRVSADARLLEGTVEVDISTLTGESEPVIRAAELQDAGGPLLQARDLVFSGTACVEGTARALVAATGMRTELGRIAALSTHVPTGPSPLEHQVRRVAWLIAAVAMLMGLGFLPIGWLVAGLPLRDALNFAIGLIAGNVPEGLLPTITLALAMGVVTLARRGALVKRLSAVETLGCTTVICTDKTGTLTQNRMRAVHVWTPVAEVDLDEDGGIGAEEALGLLARTIAASSTADLGADGGAPATGEATEIGMLAAAGHLGVDVSVDRRERQRRALFRFDPGLRVMSTVDAREDGGGLTVHLKGAPEEVLSRCTGIAAADGAVALGPGERSRVLAVLQGYASRGLRVLAVARRPMTGSEVVPKHRDDVECELTLLGLVALLDPPRPEVADAIARCHAAGIRVVVVTGDYGPTAVEIARRVGIGADAVIPGDRLDRMTEAELELTLRDHREPVFSRASPEAKLRIADALREGGHVVAMTGDGVNDAPALRRADIGVAMGITGTDVAREASTMILTDDNFATIVAAIGAGRRVFDNVRKFIVYIFAHTAPEVVPYLVFALSGGAVPLPLTVPQILAIDLGTEILPSLALGREPAEPGVMERPPRPRSEGVVTRAMLLRAWLTLGMVEAALAMAGFLTVLLGAGWRPGDPVGAGTPLHHAYLQATTMTWVGIVACQIGAGFAARTEHASLRSVGVLSNRLLLVGIAVGITIAVTLAVVPPLRTVFGTAVPPPVGLLMLPCFPVIVWGSDELRRGLGRRRALTTPPTPQSL